MNAAVTQTIHRGPCTIHVIGKRSTSGWDVIREDRPHDTQGYRKTKAKALQLALDACEPGVSTTFIVQPAHEA